MRSIGGLGLERWTRQMGTQHNTRHILHIAQKGSSPHDMSCPSKGITLCQSLIGTQGEFLCNTNTCALHSKAILTHAMSWPKSYNANSTLLTMIHYTSAHVWKRKAYKAESNGGQDKRKVDSCIGKHVGPLERGQIKCGDVEVENPISTS